MAKEIRRVGRGYWVQAPCREFPIEPHFLFPFFQYFPDAMKRYVAARWPYSWYRRGGASAAKLFEEATSIWLPRICDMKALFPDARAHIERFLGFPKSVSMFRAIPTPREE